MSFLNKLKAAFKSSPSPPKYHIYQPNELKIIAMRTRIILEEQHKKLVQTIQQENNHFQAVMSVQGQDPRISYTVLQQLSQKILEIQSLVLLVELCRKIQAYSGQIVKTNGDISQMRNQIKWFQCILWYRKNRQIHNLNDINDFCFNFFKGTDIVIPITINCDLFTTYSVMKYLGKEFTDGEYNIWEIYDYIKPYMKAKPEQLQDLISQKETYKSKIKEVNPSKLYPNQNQSSQINPYQQWSQINSYQQNVQTTQSSILPETEKKFIDLNPYNANAVSEEIYLKPKQSNIQNQTQNASSIKRINPFNSFMKKSQIKEEKIITKEEEIIKIPQLQKIQEVPVKIEVNYHEQAKEDPFFVLPFRQKTYVQAQEIQNKEQQDNCFILPVKPSEDMQTYKTTFILDEKITKQDKNIEQNKIDNQRFQSNIWRAQEYGSQVQFLKKQENKEQFEQKQYQLDFNVNKNDSGDYKQIHNFDEEQLTIKQVIEQKEVKPKIVVDNKFAFDFFGNSSQKEQEAVVSFQKLHLNERDVQDLYEREESDYKLQGIRDSTFGFRNNNFDDDLQGKNQDFKYNNERQINSSILNFHKKLNNDQAQQKIVKQQPVQYESQFSFKRTTYNSKDQNYNESKENKQSQQDHKNSKENEEAKKGDMAQFLQNNINYHMLQLCTKPSIHLQEYIQKQPSSMEKTTAQKDLDESIEIINIYLSEEMKNTAFSLQSYKKQRVLG